jgi:hypothetical protein
MYLGKTSRGYLLPSNRMLHYNVTVVDPGKGVCADPVNGEPFWGKGEPVLKGGNKERQLSPDKERDKT